MAITPLPTPSVHLEVDRVVLDGFVETDHHVLEALATCPDPETCVHQLLQLGARLSALAAGTGGLAELEARVGTRLDSLAGTTELSVQAGLRSLAEQARALFAADDGEMVKSLTTWRQGLDRHLGELFDPDHKASVVAGIERSLGDLLDAYGRRLIATTDPDAPDSPAARLVAQVRADAAEIKTEIVALSLAVGTERGRAAENERTAVKGLEYEPLVLEAVSAIAAPHGDVVEHVGRAQGTRGTKKGDIVVSLNDADGAPGCYVVEAKTRRLTLDATWRELDQAMANWEASAAVAVFASGAQAPTELPFFHAGNRAIVVLDRDEPDPAALALACLFARWVTRRQALAPSDAPDPERVAAGIERIQRSLARVSTIRRHLATSAKSTGDARGQLDELAAEVREALAELAVEVGS